MGKRKDNFTRSFQNFLLVNYSKIINIRLYNRNKTYFITLKDRVTWYFLATYRIILSRCILKWLNNSLFPSITIYIKK